MLRQRPRGSRPRVPRNRSIGWEETLLAAGTRGTWIAWKASERMSAAAAYHPRDRARLFAAPRPSAARSRWLIRCVSTGVMDEPQQGEGPRTAQLSPAGGASVRILAAQAS